MAVFRRYAGCVVIAVSAWGCGSSPSDTGSGAAAHVRILGGVAEVSEGASVALQAEVVDASGRVIPSADVAWVSLDPATASVSEAGSVRGIAAGNARIVASSGGVADTAKVRVTPVTPIGDTVDVYPELTYQVMTGWEGVAQIGEVECNPLAFLAYRMPLIDRLVNELGINRVRLEVRSGLENPVDWYTPYATTQQQAEWRAHRYNPVNDNNDPLVTNPAGFQFAEINRVVDQVVQPMRMAMAARGEQLFVNLTFVDFTASSWKQSQDPREYAELILAVFRHLQQRYGWVPDAVEVILEPDNTSNWLPTTIGNALVAAGDRLKAAGFSPDWIAPSTASMSNAVAYFDPIMAVPRAKEYLSEISYHRYSGVSAAALAALAARAGENGLRTAMLEHIGSGYQDLHQDIKDGQASSWEQFTLGYCSSQDNGGTYYLIDQSTPGDPRISMASRTRYLRQYFAFVRLNAVRVGAASGNAALDPLAFRNTNGKLAVVIRTSGSATITLRRLPPGTYASTFTTATQSFVTGPDVAVGVGGQLQASIPSAGVLTIHAR